MTSSKIKILFITRVHPPVVGGMENQSYHLVRSVKEIGDATSIINTRGKFFLPFFIPLAFFRALWSGNKYDVIHLSDAVLAPLGRIVKLFHPNLAIVCTVHGLDITYGKKNPFYRMINVASLNKLDRVIAVSRGTEEIARHFNVSPRLLTVIPNGVECDETFLPEARNNRQAFLTSLIRNKGTLAMQKIWNATPCPLTILTLGRLCRRKGVYWFLEHVLPLLESNIFYIVAGGGPEEKRLKKLIKKNHLSKRVLLLGKVSNHDKQLLMNSCDMFIQPNIPVTGDAEGFGLTVIEAASCQMPVIASNLEGIRDAICDGKNGFLIKSEDAAAFGKKINDLARDKAFREDFGNKARCYTEKNYGWNNIAQRYHEEFKRCVEEKRIRKD